MAVIISSNFYTITNHPHLHNHIQRTFQITTKNSNLSPLHHHHLHHRRLRASSKPSDYEAEEQRWLREEQRWLREEQRWLREEARWNSERQSLLRQISELSLQIQHLQSELDDFRNNRSNSADFEVTTLTKMAALLEAKNSNQILDFSGSESNSEVESVNLDSVSDVSTLNSPESEMKEETKPLEKAKSSLSSSWSTSLRIGCEGEEVRAMQDALMKLGFYSGEEDMEFSYFSTDTERAVKTWQASIGIREDGIMTLELLDQLYAPQQSSSPKTQVKADIPKDNANGAPIKVKEVERTVVKKEPTDVGISEHRVFLLGENRWEEPSRLNKGNDKLGGGKSAQTSAPKCLSCRGEGRLLCMECDGTGDSQVEEQFLDWVDGGAKCPYCEGLGYTDCDLCEGKGTA
ncbi:uncharacterized protein LOC110718895 isoform X2 [Chenopodium quinoa]|uniref:uncharacterized protein LOC110718895 isoform X2 n=1 Tax=Chenopodium quinoa TaxID=63459 RepID=UPI000B794838|nr:uncharacterized protein LOC110718895 isoform X2 [Chenopodium quinoa]